MSRYPWAAARCRLVSSPMLVALTLTPLHSSISTMFALPAMHAQCNKLNWWSSLELGFLKLVCLNSEFY